jgi:hypothetical protein
MRASTCLALRIANQDRTGKLVSRFLIFPPKVWKATLRSIMCPKGAVPVFFRSADSWAFCKFQLVELEQDLTA